MTFGISRCEEKGAQGPCRRRREFIIPLFQMDKGFAIRQAVQNSEHSLRSRFGKRDVKSNGSQIDRPYALVQCRRDTVTR
jgi:hypothetical protein